MKNLISGPRRRYFRGGIFAGAAPRRRGAPSIPPTVLYQQVIEGTGAPANTITSFGVGFRKGDLAPDDVLVYRNTADSSLLRTQINPKTYWPDGSIAHAVLHVEMPAVANGATITCEAVRGLTHGSPGSALSWATVTSGRTASATVGSGTHNLISAASASDWFAGPLCIERRATIAIPSADIGGITSMRLLADVRVYKDGSLWVDLWLRNDIALQSGGGAHAGLTASMSIDGTSVWSISSVPVEQYTAACRRMEGRISGGPAAVRPIARPATAYLADGGFVPNYDVAVGVASSVIATITTDVGSGTWDSPRDLRGLQASQGGAGDAAHIGIHTNAISCFLLSGHKDAYKQMIGQAEACGLMPLYFWDTAGGTTDGTAGPGGWLDVVRWPGMWITPTAFRAGSSLPAVPGTTTALSSGQAYGTLTDGTGLFNLTESHMGDYLSGAYLLTGRRSFLDSAIGQCHAFIARFWDFPRALDSAPSNPLVTGLGINLSGLGTGNPNQGRGFAWAMRNITRGEFLAPAGTLGKSYLNAVIDRNWDHIGTNASTWASQRGEVAGWMLFQYTTGQFPCWQHDMLLSTVLESKRFGRASAQQVLNYMRNYFTGRFLRPTVGDAFFKHFNSISDFSNNNSNTVANFHTTWAAFEGDQPGDSSWSAMDGDYFSRGLITQSMNMDDAAEGAREDVAEAWFAGWSKPEIGAPGTRPFSSAFTLNVSPRLNIVRRGCTRAAVAPGVPAGQSFTLRQDAGSGTLFGILRATGGLAETITEQGGSGASIASVSNAGVVKSAGTLTPGSYTYTVRAANATGNSGDVDVALVVTSAAPVAGSPQSFDLPSNKTNGQTVGQIAWTGAALSSAVINSGNTNGAAAVSTAGLITVANQSALAGLQGSTLNLSITLTNSYGNVTITVNVPVIAPTYVPVITAGQSWSISNTSGIGDDVGTAQVTIGTPSTGGSAATSWAITGGTGSAYFSISNAGLIEVSASLSPIATEEFVTLTLTATNAAGTSSAVTVTVIFSEAALVYGTSATSFRAAYGMRKLRTAYSGSCIRVAVGTAGGTEHDIGFDGSGHLDTATLLALNANAWIVTWYDQTVRGQHLTETDSSKRPKIVNGGALYDMVNTSQNRAVMTLGGGVGLRHTTFNLGGALTWGAMMCCNHDGSTSNSRFLSWSPDATGDDYSYPGGGNIEGTPGASYTTAFVRGLNPPGVGNESAPATGTSSSTSPAIIGFVFGANGKGRMYRDANFGTDSTYTWTALSGTATYMRVGRYKETAGNGMVGTLAEVVVFGATSDADMNTIRGSMRTYYGTP